MLQITIVSKEKKKVKETTFKPVYRLKLLESCEHNSAETKDVNQGRDLDMTKHQTRQDTTSIFF